MSRTYSFYANGQQYQFQAKRDLFYKLGDRIFEELTNFDQYQVIAKISSQNFQDFLDFLLKKKGFPSLDIDNFYDYLLLSNEFNNVLDDYLKRDEFSDICQKSMIKSVTSKEVSDKSLCEKHISEKLDVYLLLFEKEMSTVSFNSLYNIFTHEERKLLNQENAYQFIKKIFNNTNDDQTKKSICILFETLDANQISAESFKESISLLKEHFNFSPKHDLSFLNSLTQKVNEMQQEIITQIKNYFDQKINNELSQINDIKDNINQNNDQIQASVNGIQEEIQQITVKINELQNNTDNLSNGKEETNRNLNSLSEQLTSIQDKIDSNSAVNEEIRNKVNNLPEKLTSIQDKIDSNSAVNEEIRNKVNNLPENVNQIKSKIQHLPSNIDELKNSVVHLPEKINDIQFNTAIINQNCKRGIIDYLCEVSRGNLYENGTIEIETSKVCDGSLKNLFDKSKDTWFRLDNQKGGYIILDFKDRRINFHKYYFSVPSTNTGTYYGRPKSWSIEGSNDKIRWDLIDKKENDTSLHDYGKYNIFTCNKANVELYRFIRITEIEEHFTSFNYFLLSELEFYGTIREK